MAHKPKPTKAKDAEYRRLASEPMSDRAAEAEARRRWGKLGVAWHPCYAQPGDVRYCCVGRRRGDVRDEWEVLGRAESWEKAFASVKGKAA